tara:strand:- start:17882 stop:18271 length:390 start_codon:yes stop_codon:yes gene_type:complete
MQDEKGMMMKRKQGKPSHEPTDPKRATVKLHATVGTPQEIIADILSIDAKTLRKHYREELDQSTAKANANIGGALYNKALNGDTAAAIFWMKTRGGWSEKTVVDNNLNLSDDLTQLLSVVATGTKRIGT